MSTSPALTTENQSRLSGLAAWICSPDVLLRLTFLLLLAAYAQTFFSELVYDDHDLLELNPWVTSWKYVPVIFQKSFWQFADWKRLTDYYRPIVMLLFIVVRQICGTAPAWFHIAVVLVHVAAVYLSFSFVRRLTGNASLAALSAALFGLNPGRVESVAWISGVSDSLCLAFFLGAAILFLKWEETGAKRWLAISAGLMFLAILSKEVVILGPVALAVHAFSRRDGSWRERTRYMIAAMIPYGVVVTVALAARLHALPRFNAQEDYQVRLAATIFSAPEAILWYVRQQIWPNPVSIQYPLLIVKEFSWLHFALPLIAVHCIFGGIAYAVRRSAAGRFLFAWSLLTLAPAIAYHITIQVHDRYAYLPSLAASAGIAYVMLQVLDRKPRLKAVCIPLLLASLALLTFHQAAFWDNDIKVFEHAVQVGHDHSDAYAGLVTAYADRGMSAEQRDAIERWIANTPDSPYRGWYAMFSYQMGQRDYSAARQAFDKAKPGMTTARVNQGLGMIAMAEGRCVDAERYFRVTAAARPLMAEWHTRLAAALGCQGRKQEALEELKYAWKLRDQAAE